MSRRRQVFVVVREEVEKIFELFCVISNIFVWSNPTIGVTELGEAFTAGFIEYLVPTFFSLRHPQIGSIRYAPPTYTLEKVQIVEDARELLDFAFFPVL